MVANDLGDSDSACQHLCVSALLIAVMFEGCEEFQVVVNHEEQYSIWPVERELPLGWKAEGFKGSKEACLKHIEEIWTDMRPLSLRKKMEEMAAKQSDVPS